MEKRKERIEKVMKVKKRHMSTSNFGEYYFEDENGIIYHWGTSSDKAYEELQEDKYYIVSFITSNNTFNIELNNILTTVISIKNVRFKEL